MLKFKKTEEKTMKTISMFVIVLALGTGADVALGHGLHGRVDAPGIATKVTTDGASNAAFRDGLYQAKLARQRGSGAHIATGRWRSDQDRASFAAGYQQGFAQASGSSKPHAGQAALRV
jgi:hypothetical protein